MPTKLSRPATTPTSGRPVSKRHCQPSCLLRDRGATHLAERRSDHLCSQQASQKGRCFETGCAQGQRHIDRRSLDIKNSGERAQGQSKIGVGGIAHPRIDTAGYEKEEKSSDGVPALLASKLQQPPPQTPDQPPPQTAPTEHARPRAFEQRCARLAGYRASPVDSVATSAIEGPAQPSVDMSLRESTGAQHRTAASQPCRLRSAYSWLQRRADLLASQRRLAGAGAARHDVVLEQPGSDLYRSGRSDRGPMACAMDPDLVTSTSSGRHATLRPPSANRIPHGHGCVGRWRTDVRPRDSHGWRSRLGLSLFVCQSYGKCLS